MFPDSAILASVALLSVAAAAPTRLAQRGADSHPMEGVYRAHPSCKEICDPPYATKAQVWDQASAAPMCTDDFFASYTECAVCQLAHDQPKNIDTNRVRFAADFGAALGECETYGYTTMNETANYGYLAQIQVAVVQTPDEDGYQWFTVTGLGIDPDATRTLLPTPATTQAPQATGAPA